MRNRRGTIRIAAAVLQVLVPLTLAMGGCRGGLKPVEWSELGSEERPQRAARAERMETPTRREAPETIEPPARTEAPERTEPRARTEKSSRRRTAPLLRIVAKSNREVAKLSPDDVVRVMQRVGFSDDQILELGTDLYNALGLSGGAEVHYGRDLEMIFAIQNQQVHIQSRSRGTFVYDVTAHRFVLGSGSGR